jgi:hypothetical protein
MLNRFCLIPLILLLSACAPPSYQGYIMQNNNEGVKQLHQAGENIDTLDYWGTPLAAAARTNNLEVAQYLIDNGADLNLGNSDGYESKTPLHAAAAHNSVEVAKLLLANGADTTIRNRENETPLQVAQVAEQQGMIDLLNEFNKMQSAWQRTVKTNTYQAYSSFLQDYPGSRHQTEAETKRNAIKTAHEDKQLKQQKLAALEASLPPSVRRDKYMVQLSQHLKQRDYQKALEIFPKLESLPVATDPSLKFFYGEALLETGKPGEALKKLYAYVTEQGSGAKHYARALALINQAESQL